MDGIEKSCADNVPPESHLATEHHLRSSKRVTRTRPSYAWDLNPDLEPDATVYGIYLRYLTCGMCTFREFKNLGIDAYHLRLFYRMVIFIIRHEMSKDTTLAIKNGLYDEWYDWCENLCWEATRNWTSSRRKGTPGTPENRPLHEQPDESRRRIWKGPTDVPGDARKKYNPNGADLVSEVAKRRCSAWSSSPRQSGVWDCSGWSRSI